LSNNFYFDEWFGGAMGKSRIDHINDKRGTIGWIIEEWVVIQMVVSFKINFKFG